jgi:hypothetical protein
VDGCGVTQAFNGLPTVPGVHFIQAILGSCRSVAGSILITRAQRLASPRRGGRWSGRIGLVNGARLDGCGRLFFHGQGEGHLSGTCHAHCMVDGAVLYESTMQRG